MYLNKKVAVAIPSYKEENQIRRVLETMPDYVDLIIVVDDASPEPDQTCEIVKEMMKEDPRILLVAREENGGVGAAIEDGYRESLEHGADVVAVMAGDGQMDPDELYRIVEPVARGKTDLAKGNRYNLQSDWSVIPRVRLIGSIILSFMTRLATGYWTIGDPQNGYNAASSKLVEQFVRNGLYPRYGVPNDLLITCAVYGARVQDVSMEPVYDVGEQSKLRPSRVAFPIFLLLLRGFWKRMYYRHFLIETTPVPLAYLAGLLSFLSGLGWSLVLLTRSIQVAVTTPEVVAATLLFMGGAIVTLLAVVLDVLFSSRMIVANQDESDL